MNDDGKWSGEQNTQGVMEGDKRHRVRGDGSHCAGRLTWHGCRERGSVASVKWGSLAVLAHKVWHVTDLTYYRFHSLIFILNICGELSRKSFILTKFKTKVLFHRHWETERKAVSLWHHTAKIFAISRWTEVCSSHYNRPVSSNGHQE